MKIKTLILATCIILTYHCKSQTTYVINRDTVTCLTEPQLDKVLGAFIDRDLCLQAYDTLSVGFDSCLSANEDLEQAVELLKEDLQVSKSVSDKLKDENDKLKNKKIPTKVFAGIEAQYGLPTLSISPEISLLINWKNKNKPHLTKEALIQVNYNIVDAVKGFPYSFGVSYGQKISLRR